MGRFGLLHWEVVHFCILKSADVLTDREKLGAHSAGSGSLARRNGPLNERIIVVVDLRVIEAQDASFHHPPTGFNGLFRGRFGSNSGHLLQLCDSLEEVINHPDPEYDVGISHQPADRRIDGHWVSLRAHPARSVVAAGVIGVAGGGALPVRFNWCGVGDVHRQKLDLFTPAKEMLNWLAVFRTCCG